MELVMFTAAAAAAARWSVNPSAALSRDIAAQRRACTVVTAARLSAESVTWQQDSKACLFFFLFRWTRGDGKTFDRFADRRAFQRS